MGSLHAQKFASLREVRIVSVCDVDSARADALASGIGTRAAREFGAADAAVVAVSTEQHFAVARECLERGLNVLIEKPLCSTLDQARELVALAKAKKRILQVGHVERYNNTFQALSKRMGRPLFIEAERLSGFKRRGADVDVVLDLMIHDVDLVLALCPHPIAAVRASGFRILTSDIDIANARIEFADGCVANLSASRVSQAQVRKLRIFQKDLYVSADLQAGKLRYVRRADGALQSSEETQDKGDALAVQAASFVSAIAGHQQPEVSGEDGLRAMEVAFDVGRLVRERLQAI